MTDDLERRLRISPADMPSLDVGELRAQLARKADAAGLLDVAYGTYESPLGPLTLFVTPRGVVRIAYPEEPLPAWLDQLAERVSPRVMEAPERTDAVRRQLEEYFEGARSRFDVAVDWRLIRGFARGVLRATARVPFGTVSTYRDVAARAGSPNGYRAAGNALGSNPIPIVVPCHRILHADGGLGGYAGGLERKKFLLELEGVLPG